MEPQRLTGQRSRLSGSLRFNLPARVEHITSPPGRQLTPESISITLRTLVTSGTLYPYMPSRMDPGDVLRRDVYIHSDVVQWTYSSEELARMLPAGPAHLATSPPESKPVDTQATLKRHLCDCQPSVCAGRKCSADLKRLDTGHLHVEEVFELRTFRPNSVRLFGFMPAQGILVLTNARSRAHFNRPNTKRRRQVLWDEEIKKADTTRRAMNLLTFASTHIDKYC